MHKPKLRSIFEKALLPTLVSPLLLAGCAKDPLPTEGFTAPACENGELSVAGLAPPVIPDVLEYRYTADFGDGPRLEVVSRTGTPCATATDAAACTTAFAEARGVGGFAPWSRGEQVPVVRFLAMTKGDDVSVVDSNDALKAFLGTIDSPQEAAFLARLSYGISCQNLERGGVRAVDGGFEVLATTGDGCGPGNDVTQYRLKVASDGTITEEAKVVVEEGDVNCAIGRRPEGLERAYASKEMDSVGRHFASAAYLEAASVPAFTRLARELRAQGAPETFVRRAMSAARDEVRHTQMTRKLAEDRGATAQRPRVGKLPVRELSEIALENAVEGCVRETYGALVAHHQALHANNAEIRSAMKIIADDETEHAALSWDVAQWLESRLDASAHEELRRHQREAIRVLREEAQASVDGDLERVAGWPSRATALQLIGELEQTLWC